MNSPEPLDVVFVPIWEKNPYQRELAYGLSEYGVSVRIEDQLKSLFAELRAGLYRPKVLHLHALPWFKWGPLRVARYAAFFWRIQRMRRAGVRVVWTLHDFGNHDAPHRRIEHWVGAWLAHRVDAIVVHGPTAKRIICQRWGADLEPIIHVIPHGNFIGTYPNTVSRSEARRALGLAQDERVILFLGLIRTYKGVEQLAESFRGRGGAKNRLVIAGQSLDPGLQLRIESAARSDARILFHPKFVADDEIQVYLNAADVVALPYRRVFTSGAAVLAMSFGKACIAPQTGCVVDAVGADGAIFFDPEKEGDLDRAVEEVLSGRRDLEEMGRRNRNKIAEWDWKRMAEATATLYREVLPTPSPELASTRQ